MYRAHQKIPAEFAEFYEELFQILLVRHDRSKPGYERKRKTNLSDREMQQIFEAFCYKTKAQRLNTIQKSKALDIAAECIAKVGCTCNEAHFLADIKSVTCLLSEEGGSLDFLHQSVQEFFAARYILTRPDNVAKKFYASAVDSKWINWQQELLFLSKIDAYRSGRDFFIPSYEKILKEAGYGQPVYNELARNLVASNIGVRQRIHTSQETQTPKYFVFDKLSTLYYGAKCFSSHIYKCMFERDAPILWQELCFDKTTDGQTISYLKMAEKCQITQDLDLAIQAGLDEIAITIENHKRLITSEDSSDEFMDL